jgi:alkylation response protein AidB-like acyl-CoA dehydrogenase
MATHITEREARQVAEAAREGDWKLPSFGKDLFLGRLRLDLIHPQPKLDAAAVEKGEAFLAALRAFLTEHVDPLAIERDAKIPDAVLDGLKALGALGMKVPEQYGGLGLSQVYYNRALALAGSMHASLSTLLSAHQSIGVAEPLLLFGTEEQKQRWLPLVARTHVSAFLLTEPDVGSDPARLGATATPTEDGSGYLLNGTKLWATNGAIADIVVVMAKVPKGGITAFVLPYDSDGVTVEHRNAFMGLRGIENSVTLLKDVFVPNENVIGKEGQGLKIALSTLNTGRLALPAICVGTSKWAVKVAREWSSQRVQWGQPVGKHDAVAQKVAFIAASAFGMEAMLDVASRMADDKRNDIRIEAAIAKLYASELGWRVVDELMQVRGGRGYETAARHADQPHLRGLDGDHAPADRPRGRGPAPAGRRRAARGRGRPEGQGQVGGAGGRVLRALAPQAGGRPGSAARLVRRAGRARRPHALRRALLAPPRALDVLRDGPLAGEAGEAPGGARAHRRHRRRAVRDRLRRRLRRHAKARRAAAGRRGARAG